VAEALQAELQALAESLGQLAQATQAQRTAERVAVVETTTQLAVTAVLESFTFDGRSDMAHFAKVTNNEIGEVIVVANSDCGGGTFPESEPIGQAFIASLGIDGTWLQTSYSGSFRNLYAGPGMLFDPTIGEYGAFVIPPEKA